MVSRPGLGSDPSFGSGRESGRDMLSIADDVATLISLQTDVATVSNSEATSRHKGSVNNFSSCRDFFLVSRPHCPLY